MPVRFQRTSNKSNGFLHKLNDLRSRHSDRLRAGRPGFDSRNDEIFLFSTPSRPALGPTQPPIQWVSGAISSEVKQPGREADHSPQSSAEVKNGRAILPLPHKFAWHST
jgi:hypothetical protein